MKSRETTAMVLMVFVTLYVTLVMGMGMVDTLRSEGTDRIINTEIELVLVTIPILFAFVWYMVMYSKDRFSVKKNEYE